MGKCTRKCKGIGEVAVMEVSQVVGVKTRAVQKREAGEMQVPYLELRNRRLVKREKQGDVCSRLNVPERHLESGKANVRIRTGIEVGAERGKGSDFADIEVEFSIGENSADRALTASIRETSPLNNLRADSGALESTASSIGVNSVQKPSAAAATMPSVAEIEEFFSVFEKEEQRRFTEKYNYDTVKDIPLAGRYEWVKATP